MGSSKEKHRRAWKWIRWLLFSEGLILLLALAGPGHRAGAYQPNNHDLLANFFIENPSYLQAVAVNLIAIHLFIVCIFFAAWFVTRWQQKKG
jgi:hypothetical protein